LILSTLLLSGCFIKGRVVDENGAGVAGVTLKTYHYTTGELITITTDGAGYYQLGTFDRAKFLKIISNMF
jgi:hypothetical protein